MTLKDHQILTKHAIECYGQNITKTDQLGLIILFLPQWRQFLPLLNVLPSHIRPASIPIARNLHPSPVPRLRCLHSSASVSPSSVIDSHLRNFILLSLPLSAFVQQQPRPHSPMWPGDLSWMTVQLEFPNQGWGILWTLLCLKWHQLKK